MQATDTQNEKDWLLKLHQGDERVYREVFTQYYAPLCVYAETFTTDPNAAEDVVEEVLLQLWEGKPLFKDEEHLKAFLYHSIRNAGLNALKRDKREAARQYTYLDKQDSFQEAYLSEITRTEAMMELYKAVASLPTQAGKIIRMTYLEGKSNQETADLLGLSVNTVKAQKQRGLSLLRDRLPDDTYLMLVGYMALKLFFHAI